MAASRGRFAGARATPHVDLHWCQHKQLGSPIVQGLQGMRWAEYDRVCKSPDDGLQNRELSWWLHKATCDLAALEPVPDQASQEVLAGLHPLTPQIGFSSNELRSAGSFGDFPAVSGQTRNSTASPQRSCRPLAGWPTESPQRAERSYDRPSESPSARTAPFPVKPRITVQPLLALFRVMSDGSGESKSANTKYGDGC